jgi:hypothetical protein
MLEKISGYRRSHPTADVENRGEREDIQQEAVESLAFQKRSVPFEVVFAGIPVIQPDHLFFAHALVLYRV